MAGVDDIGPQSFRPCPGNPGSPRRNPGIPRPRSCFPCPTGDPRRIAPPLPPSRRPGDPGYARESPPLSRSPWSVATRSPSRRGREGNAGVGGWLAGRRTQERGPVFIGQAPGLHPAWSLWRWVRRIRTLGLFQGNRKGPDVVVHHPGPGRSRPPVPAHQEGAGSIQVKGPRYGPVIYSRLQSVRSPQRRSACDLFRQLVGNHADGLLILGGEGIRLHGVDVDHTKISSPARIRITNSDDIPRLSSM